MFSQTKNSLVSKFSGLGSNPKNPEDIEETKQLSLSSKFNFATYLQAGEASRKTVNLGTAGSEKNFSQNVVSELVPSKH